MQFFFPSEGEEKAKGWEMGEGSEYDGVAPFASEPFLLLSASGEGGSS